jgi:hypothetical protein
MNPFFINHADEDLKDQSDKHLLAINEPPYSMDEGSEFLDDAIRMKDLPLMFSDEKIDTGGSRNLF